MHAAPTIRVRRTAWAFGRWLPGLMLAILPRPVAAAPADTPAEPKTLTLFMGADVFVQKDKEFRRVEDVVGGSFVVKVKGKEVGIPTEAPDINLKADRSLKITATSVTIGDLKAVRGYTPGNDPVMKFAAASNDAQAMQGDVGALLSRMVNAKDSAARDAGSAHPLGGAGVDLAAATRNYNKSSAAANASIGMVASANGAMQDELAEEMYDALDVEFDVASNKTFSRPYVVVMLQYHEKGARPGDTHHALYAMALRRLDSEPQSVRIHKTGFPRGFEVEKYQLHIYDGGREAASNLAENQARLTRTEAFTYLLLDYEGTHKGATLPAAPALGRLNPEERTRLTPDQFGITYRVQVAKDGLPGAAFTDAGLSNPAEPAVAALIANVRFYPALDKGKPVEGVAELQFGRLAL
jgi:hypothetical protein